MYIYLGVFLGTAGLFYISDKVKYRQARQLLICLSILAPAILAGCRADSIGVDVTVYGISFFERAINSNGMFDFLKQQAFLGHMDSGFNILVYLSSVFSKNYHFSLFVYQLFTLTVVYFALKRCNRIFDTPIYAGMLLYYLSMYNLSLNIMRQAIAASLVFLAATYIFEKKYKTFCIVMACAFFMHSSAIIGILLLPMYLLLHSGRNVSLKKQITQCCVLLMGVFVIVMIGSSLIESFVNIGVLKANYLEYLSGGKYSIINEGRSVSLVAIVFQMFYLIILTLHHEKLQYREKEPLFFSMVSCIVLITSCFGPLFAEYVSRVSYYFVPLQMIALTNTALCYSRKKFSRGIWIMLIVSVVFLSWIRSYVIYNYGATIPYKFFVN